MPQSRRGALFIGLVAASVGCGARGRRVLAAIELRLARGGIGRVVAANLAALLGLPFGFASHFAPQALYRAIGIYRERFEPSPQLERPHVIVGVNVVAADTEATAQAHLELSRRARVRNLFRRGDEKLTEDQVDAILRSPQSAQIDEMLRYAAVGTPATVRAYLEDFVEKTEADELIVVHHAPSVADRLRSVELLAEAVELTAAASSSASS